jgi:paraquat-inducible protein A
MTSLAARFPRYTIALTALWAIAVLGLASGLLLPAVRITRLRLIDETLSVVEGIATLWRDGSWLLAIVVALFSVFFPVAKLAVVAWWWLGPRARRGLPQALVVHTAKWSMLDVMVVAILVASMQGGLLVRLRPEIGIYLFGAATFVGMLLTWLIERLDRQANHTPSG